MGYNGEKYNFNSRYLFEYYKKNHPEYRVYFILNDIIEYKKYKRIYGESIINSTDEPNIKRIFSAGVWITSGGLPFRFPFINRNRVVVNIGHGMPLKGLGLDNKDNTLIQNIGIRLIYSQYDLISATSKLFQSFLKRSYASSNEQVQIIGNCWSDSVLNYKNPMEVLMPIYKSLPSFKKIILYAPTWREHSDTWIFPFKDFEISQLEDFLERNSLIIFLRIHHLDMHNISKYSNCKRVILMNQDVVEDIMDILSIFDILITDYSSIIVDYLLLNRPAILLPYDKEKYTASRSLNLSVESFNFYDEIINMKDFLNVIEKVASDNKITEKQNKTLDLFFKYKDKQNCERHYQAIKRLIEKKLKK